jgi:hypothetical protein
MLMDYKHAYPVEYTINKSCTLCEIRGFHGDEDSRWGLLGFDTV